MISRKIFGLAESFDKHAADGDQVLSALRQRSLAALLRDIAAQVDALERAALPANARHTGQPSDNVVVLRPVRLPIAPVINSPSHGGAA
jgi:hypothetical protein